MSLKRKLPGISDKMLFQQLQELEKDSLIKKRELSQTTYAVEYSLTSLGKSLRGVVNSIHRWGEKNAHLLS